MTRNWNSSDKEDHHQEDRDTGSNAAAFQGALGHWLSTASSSNPVSNASQPVEVLRVIHPSTPACPARCT